MTKYIVNTLCILNQENPTPSKSMDITINIIPVRKNKKFENFVLGIDNFQQCCEGFGAECTLGEWFEEEKFIESIEVYIDVPDTLYPTYVDCDRIEKVYGNNFNEFRHEFMGNLPHDNPNHKESINEHILMCVQNSETKQLKEISKYHDLGKFICKEFVSEHRAAYHNHAFVSAMYYLAKIDVTNQEKLDNMEVIYQHIAVMDDLADKQIKRNELEKIVPLMLEFREIDKKSRII